ncbi:hypothetical protein C8F04DRAFT_358787 [Mycena alexandri]|uniref:Uncharacterized protein n=1 Tax=Mycena alexandri TaxID=1745969 RepID=A0AAD6WN55_9AGAR|nr:hypothetical protein C8F04DRAFT_358787 [Mycena alexandri]
MVGWLATRRAQVHLRGRNLVPSALDSTARVGGGVREGGEGGRRGRRGRGTDDEQRRTCGAVRGDSTRTHMTCAYVDASPPTAIGAASTVRARGTTREMGRRGSTWCRIDTAGVRGYRRYARAGEGGEGGLDEGGRQGGNAKRNKREGGKNNVHRRAPHRRVAGVSKKWKRRAGAVHISRAPSLRCSFVGGVDSVWGTSA